MLLDVCFCGLLTQGFSYNMSVVQANAFSDVNVELVQLDLRAFSTCLLWNMKVNYNLHPLMNRLI